MIGNAYEYLIGKFAVGRGQEGRRVLHAARGVQADGAAGRPAAGRPHLRPGVRLGLAAHQVRASRSAAHNFALYGQEANGSTWALGKMNMFLHGIGHHRVEWGDTIRNPKLLEDDQPEAFDVVVANPPFSLDKWGAEGAAGRPVSAASTAACRRRARATTPSSRT